MTEVIMWRYGHRVQSVKGLQIFCVWCWISLASPVGSQRGVSVLRDGRKALVWCALFGTGPSACRMSFLKLPWNDPLHKRPEWGCCEGTRLVDCSRHCVIRGFGLEAVCVIAWMTYPHVRWLVAMVTGLTCIARLLLCFIPPVTLWLKLPHQNRTHLYTEACASISFIHGGCEWWYWLKLTYKLF